MQRMIYLDYLSTTPADPEVIAAMLPFLGVEGCFGNPASKTHEYGRQALMAVEKAREQVAALIQAEPQDIIWTSGGTESDNLAILGACRFYQRSGKHIITSQIEHKAVLDSCRQAEREGFSVTYLAPDQQGQISPEALQAAIREDTILVSIMHANNEIGVLQDIPALAAITRNRGILFHSDAAQSAGKVPINVKSWGVDLLTLSAHKIYGPKGIGALYCRSKPKLHLEPLIVGGGHERGFRSGTLPTHQIVGMGKACELAQAKWREEAERLTSWRQILWEQIAHIDGIRLQGDPINRLPGCLCFTVKGIRSEALLNEMPALALSSSAACQSALKEPSYVLRALGVPAEEALSMVRLSMGRFTSEVEVKIAANMLVETILKLRSATL